MGEKLIIHHWDTDGICSASILLKNLNGETKTVIPKIGNYFLTDEEIDILNMERSTSLILLHLRINKTASRTC